MLLKNKEGNCIRDVKGANKIEALKRLGFSEVKTAPKTAKSPKEDKNPDKGKEPEVKEKTDGSVTVTV